MYSIPPISAIPILAIMNYNHCSGSDVYLTSNGFTDPLFWGGPPTCSILRKKKECPIGTARSARSGIIVIVIGR